MAGQKERAFRTDESGRGASVVPAASVRTNQAQAVAAVSQGQGNALNALGGALSNFFGTAAKTIDQLGDIEHREDLVLIERQRKARAAQAQADHANGVPRSADLNVYQDYKETYDQAVADETASRVAADLAGAIDRQPNTPFDVTGFAFEYTKTQLSGGTGDPLVDGMVAAQVKKRAEVAIARKNDAIARTSESNIAQTITKSLTNKMFNQGGVTTEQTEGFYSEALGLAKGDVAKADRLFTQALTEAIYNPGHAASTLAALRDSGFAQRNPDVYREITEKAWVNTNRIKSVAAGQEVQSVNDAYHAAAAKHKNAGTLMPTEDYLGFLRQAADVHSRHGVGRSQFPWMGADLDAHAGARQALKDQGDVNQIYRAYTGAGDGNLRRTLSSGEGDQEFGKVMGKQFIPFVNTVVSTEAARYPSLAAAQQGGGGYNFMASRDTAREFGSLLSNGADGFGSVGYAVDDNTAAQVGDAIMSGDPSKTIIAAELVQSIKLRPGGEQMLRSVLRDDQARARADVILQRAADSGGLENAVRMVNADRAAERRMGKELKEGGIDWKAATLDPELKIGDLRTQMAKTARDTLLDSQDRDPWFGFKPDVALHPAAQAKLERLAAIRMHEEQDNLPLGKKPDTAKAFKWAAEQIKSEFVPVSAQGNVLRYIPDPYGGKGRQLKDPVAIYNGKPVYSGMKMQNALNKEEDPQATFTKIDRPAIAKTFEGYLGTKDEKGDPVDIYLMPPDRKPGLHQVMTTGQRPLTFVAGQGVRLSGKDTPVPTSPADADNFFRTNLPAGFVAVKGALDGQGRNTYQIHYGYRLVGDGDAKAKTLADLQWARKDAASEIKRNTDATTGAVQLQPKPTAYARP